MRSSQQLTNKHHRKNEKKEKKHGIELEFGLYLFMEVVLILLYAFCTEYSSDLSITAGTGSQASTLKYYPFFQDVHIMIFIGFGFLMVFLKTHSWTSIAQNFLVASLSIQWSILTAGFWHQVFSDGDWHRIPLDIKSLITGDFGAGAVLITLGALLGKVTTNQLLVVAVLEGTVWGLAEAICVTQYKAVDMGGSIYVHMFGAYFGVMCSWMATDMSKWRKFHRKYERGDYHSQLIAMIGTLFLWCYWPSFNGALAEGNAQMRVIVNTVLAITASCITTFGTSSLYCKGHFDIEDILNATLAGGVIVGSTSDMMDNAYGVIILGSLGGIISTLCFHMAKMPWHDTCGVHNLHGIPGIIGGISGAIYAYTLEDGDVETIFGARDQRTAAEQGNYQLAALGTVWALTCVGGLITGLIIGQMKGPKIYFNDYEYWLDCEKPEEWTAVHTVKHSDDESSDQIQKNKV